MLTVRVFQSSQSECSATHPIARLSGRLASLRLLVECSLRRWSRGFWQHAASLRNGLSLQGQSPTHQGNGRCASLCSPPNAHLDGFQWKIWDYFYIKFFYNSFPDKSKKLTKIQIDHRVGLHYKFSPRVLSDTGPRQAYSNRPVASWR